VHPFRTRKKLYHKKGQSSRRARSKPVICVDSVVCGKADETEERDGAFTELGEGIDEVDCFG